MNADQQKIVQYLNEAHASEQALVSVLTSQIAMTPTGTYRTGLETHLKETRSHGERVAKRLADLNQGGNPLAAVVGAAETVVGQVLAFTKTPLDLLRGTGGEEKVLKNAKDACATEALEIATYTAIEQLATAVGDRETARLAASIRGDEEKMLQRILKEIPKLTDAVVKAEVNGEPSFDVTKTGAADAVKKTTKTAKRSAKKAAAKARSVAQLPIARYDSLNADEVIAKLDGLSEAQLAKVGIYEKANQNRTTVLDRVQTAAKREAAAA